MIFEFSNLFFSQDPDGARYGRHKGRASVQGSRQSLRLSRGSSFLDFPWFFISTLWTFLNLISSASPRHWQVAALPESRRAAPGF